MYQKVVKTKRVQHFFIKPAFICIQFPYSSVIFMILCNFSKQTIIMSSKNMINISCILDLSNYLSSLQRWLQIYKLHQSNPIQEQRFFNLYIRIIKPKIHKYHHLVSTLSESSYGFFCDKLSKLQIETLKEVYGQLRKFEILSMAEVKQAEKENQYNFLSAESIKNLLKQPITNIFRISLNQQPKNEQLAYWGSYMKVIEVQFQSFVIHGKGIAKKELGFPTANLLIDENAELTLKQHPNGVYLVEFTFLKGPKYWGVCCIGTNPHYENLKHKRLIQVYLFHEFSQDFYDQAIKMKLVALMRFQGKFESFDCFLNAMHNDIEMGKRIAKDLKLSKI